MASIFDKARTLVLSNIHSLLDKAIDLNSTEAVKQHVRDLETALQSLESSAAEAKGYERTTTREINDLTARAAVLNEAIDLILGDDDPTNNHVATAKQVQLDGVETALTDKQTELAEAQAIARKLVEAVSSLKAKHAEMVNQVRKLENLERSTKAKTAASKAMEAAAAVTASGDAVSVDNVVARMKAQGDVADVKFENALGTFNEATGQDSAIVTAQARIAARKKALDAKKQTVAGGKSTAQA